MTNSTETFFIRLYSTDARLSWDQFQCILMDIVTLSTDTNDCDLRHQCISEFDLHLCTWAQCCSGNGHNFLGPIPHCSMAISTVTLFCDLFQPLLLVWPIPQMQVGLIPNLTLWPIPQLPLGPIPFRHHFQFRTWHKLFRKVSSLCKPISLENGPLCPLQFHEQGTIMMGFA